MDFYRQYKDLFLSSNQQYKNQRQISIPNSLLFQIETQKANRINTSINDIDQASSDRLRSYDILRKYQSNPDTTKFRDQVIPKLDMLNRQNQRRFKTEDNKIIIPYSKEKDYDKHRMNQDSWKHKLKPLDIQQRSLDNIIVKSDPITRKKPQQPSTSIKPIIQMDYLNQIQKNKQKNFPSKVTSFNFKRQIKNTSLFQPYDKKVPNYQRQNSHIKSIPSNNNQEIFKTPKNSHKIPEISEITAIRQMPLSRSRKRNVKETEITQPEQQQYQNLQQDKQTLIQTAPLIDFSEYHKKANQFQFINKRLNDIKKIQHYHPRNFINSYNKALIRRKNHKIDDQIRKKHLKQLFKEQEKQFWDKKGFL